MPESRPVVAAFARIPETETVAEAVELNGEWQFKATDEEEWQGARVPGCVFTDLIRLGRVEDPHYRDNELKVQWVEKKEWEYRRAFCVSGQFLRHDRIILDCRGLDTIAEICLNGEPVAQTRNMFREYRFDVKPLLVEGENLVHIVFRSVLEWNRKLIEAEPRVTWGDEKGVSFFVRRCGTDYGWNWGPRLLPCGIWRPIRLAAHDTGRIKDLLVRQGLDDSSTATLRIEAEVEQWTPGRLALEIEISLDGRTVAREAVPVSGARAEARIAISEPRLWWPNGWGEQPLYTVTATLKNGSDAVHQRKTRIGLRTVELSREKDGRGETFGFKINGHLIFCKGANWVPCDSFHDRVTEAHYIHLLSSCKEANMNMLRLWGGGLYAPECFYDYCDEHGIMIWHDFMFAVGPYRADEWYLESIREEIADVVRRLRHHPSIVLWCGNNEQESSMPKWLKQYEALKWEDFERIFYDVIPHTAALHDPDRPYWPSSPHHPLDKLAERPDHKTASGDAHLWDAWHGGQPFKWYAENMGFRFVSEIGHQAMPPMETLRSFTAPEDRSFPSPVLDLHNKVGRTSLGNEIVGNERLAAYLARYFRIPTSLDDWVYVTQLNQGEAMKTGAETYRRNYPATTGMLYWQIDDNWPTISGSSIDYFGRWKALHYMARRFFNPVLICGRVEGTTVGIWGINDLLTEVSAHFQWHLARFSGDEVRCGAQRVTLPANSSTLLAQLDLAGEVGEHPAHVTYRNDSYENRRQYYLAYHLTGDGGELSANVSFFVLPKYLALEDPRLHCEVHEQNGHLSVEVSARLFAAYVELGIEGGYARFTDNYFHLQPGRVKRVELVESTVSAGEAAKRLRARNLVDSYRPPTAGS